VFTYVYSCYTLRLLLQILFVAALDIKTCDVPNVSSINSLLSQYCKASHFFVQIFMYLGWGGPPTVRFAPVVPWAKAGPDCDYKYYLSGINMLLDLTNQHNVHFCQTCLWFAERMELETTSAYWNQRDALFIQLIENWGPLHVSSITFSSSGGATQAALGILRACYVSWLHLDWSEAPHEDEHVMLETCRGP
jgi:hypothetical protein